MFDIGWTEMIVVAIVAILVVGPKDLPGMLRAFGKTVGNLRRMAGDFQRQFDDAIKEADLDEVKKLAKSTSYQPLEDAKKSMQSFQKSMKETVAVETGAKDAAKGGEAASGIKAKPAAPAKTGATSKSGPAKKSSARKSSNKTSSAKPSSAKTGARSGPKSSSGKRAASAATKKPVANGAAKPNGATGKPSGTKPAKTASSTRRKTRQAASTSSGAGA